MSEELKESSVQALEIKMPPSHKKPRKKLAIFGVVIVVIVLIGCGFWVWHESPGFCNAMCHDSMNSYVESYDQEAGQQGTDKYGNAVSNTNAMLAVSHKDDSMECLTCHVPSLSQQLGEVQETITGDYYVVNRADGDGVALREVGNEDLVVNAGGTPGTADSFCLRSGCHVTESGEAVTRTTLTEMTADMDFNPHDWKHGQIDCSDCHKSHRASVLYCTRCHYDAVSSVPEGWVTYEESQQILEATTAS